MNNTIKYILIFAAGAGCGFLVAKKVLVKGYAELEEELVSGQELIEKRYAEMEDLADSVQKDIYNAKSSLEEGLYTREQNKAKREKIDYSKISRLRVEDPIPIYADGLTPIGAIDITPETSEDPYIITDQEFTDEFPHFDKTTLYYYAYDDVLTDEDESLIDDIDAIIGDETLNIFADMSPAQNSIWVRNECLGSDFEVIRLNSSYEQHVMGTPRKGKEV